MAIANLLDMTDKRGNDRQKALESALAQIERQFGKGSIMRMGADNPVAEIEALGEAGLLAELETLDGEEPLFVEPGERKWSVHGHPGYDEEPPRLPGATSWVAECQLPADSFPDDYCFGDEDCSNGQTCLGGVCVSCASDADCGPGQICDGQGQCVEED